MATTTDGIKYELWSEKTIQWIQNNAAIITSVANTVGITPMQLASFMAKENEKVWGQVLNLDNF